MVISLEIPAGAFRSSLYNKHRLVSKNSIAHANENPVEKRACPYASKSVSLRITVTSSVERPWNVNIIPATDVKKNHYPYYYFELVVERRENRRKRLEPDSTGLLNNTQYNIRDLIIDVLLLRR